MNFKLCLWIIAATVPLITSCQQKKTPIEADQIQLSTFSNCGALEQHIEDTAVEQMKTSLDYYKDSPIRALDASVPPSKSTAPAAYTKTNTQVAAVDEPDIVKTNGQKIFTLTGDKLYMNTSWPPESLAISASATVEGYPQEMFLDEQNRVVVLSTIYDYGNGGNSDFLCLSLRCVYGVSSTKVTVFDTQDGLKVRKQFYLHGQYLKARRVGASVRLVVSDWLAWPKDVRWYPEMPLEDTAESKSAWAEAIEALKVRNEKVIRAQTLADWLPRSEFKNEAGQNVSMGYECGDFYAQSLPSELGFLTVATLNLDNPEPVLRRTSILAQPGEIYASEKALYVSSQRYVGWNTPSVELQQTYLHKFDITNPNRSTYRASGKISGYLLNQFSMDEYQDRLRAATTVDRFVPDTTQPDAPWAGTFESTNFISVLEESAGQLKTVGKTQALAPGERIYSARFIGPRGYVVTFRQVDPLFTFDLSNPTAPKAIGELKIPGFSSYLHPIDERYLLAIGTYVPENPSAPNERHLQLSLFDVSDPAHPQQKFTTQVGTAYGWSEAAYEHRAFNYFAERKLLAIPFSDWKTSDTQDYWESLVTDVRLFKIDVDNGLTPLGNLSVNDYPDAGNQYSVPWIRRSIMATDAQGQDFVYALADTGIRVAALSNLKSPVGKITYPTIPNPNN